MAMADYQLNYTWDASHAVPLLVATISGRLLNDRQALGQIIDQTHAVAEQHIDYEEIFVAYDLSQTERRLPLHALMGRSRISLRVKRVYVIGAGSRKDEMAVLIMSAAKRLPYEVRFCGSLDEVHKALSTLDARS
jgi:hypothetical protein